MDEKTAQRIAAVMQQVTGKLDESIRLVQSSSNEAEFLKFREVVGNLMGRIYLDVLQPIYNEHPSLMPEELRLRDN
jgi:hypothetical protein